MKKLERDVLSRYADGGEPRDIANDLKVDFNRVVEVIAAVGFQRPRAAKLLHDDDAHTKTEGTTVVLPATPAAKPPTKPRHDPPRPADQPTPATTAGPVSVDQVLARAEQLGRFSHRVNRIRVLAAELDRDMDTQVEVFAAEQEVDRLRVELANATAKVKALRAGVTAATPAPVGSDADIRAWAAANNVACPAHGRVPKAVRDEYAGRAV